MSRIGQGMSDGRAFTTYVSPGVLNARLARQLGFTGCEDAYRQALQTAPRPRMWFTGPPTPPVSWAQRPGKNLPGVIDTAPVNCAPGFFPKVL